METPRLKLVEKTYEPRWHGFAIVERELQTIPSTAPGTVVGVTPLSRGWIWRGFGNKPYREDVLAAGKWWGPTLNGRAEVPLRAIRPAEPKQSPHG